MDIKQFFPDDTPIEVLAELEAAIEREAQAYEASLRQVIQAQEDKLPDNSG